MRTQLLLLLLLPALLAGCAHPKEPDVQQFVPSARVAPLAFRHETITLRTTNRIFFVGGEVRQPGRFIWREGLTLTNAIEIAGGLTDFADSDIKLRRSNGSEERYSLRRYHHMISGSAENPVISPNDQVIVPKRFL
jgi:hypothetical protein